MRPAPDSTELDAQRRARTTEGLGLFAPAEPERHEVAIKSAEDSATPGETQLVERIQSMLRTRFRFTADDVAMYLTQAGVPRSGPQAGNVRRRLASRIVNPGKGRWWTKVDEVMTGDAVRSGRRIAVWQVIQFPPPLDNGEAGR